MDTTHKNNEDDKTIDIPGANHVAATFPAVVNGLDEKLQGVPGVESVELLAGDHGLEALSPDSLFERVRRGLSEERRPLERLEEALDDGGSVALVAHGGEDETVTRLTKMLGDAGAGWIFGFSELTWSELRSPQSGGGQPSV